MKLYIEIDGKKTELAGNLFPGAVSEAKKYSLSWEEERADARLGDYCLYISDIPQQPSFFLREGIRVEIKWMWEPEFFSGQFFPELYCQGKKLWPESKTFEGITVDTDLDKLTRQQFCSMVEEISAIAFSLSPAFRKTSLGKGGRKFALAQMELIINYLGKILRTVECIARNPRKKLVNYRQDVPLYQARQIDEHSILRIVANTAGFTKFAPHQVPAVLKPVAAKTNNYLFDKISEVTSHISFNTYENAFVKGFLLKLLMLTYKLERQLGALVSASQQDLLRQNLTKRRRLQVISFKKAIQEVLCLPFLQEVEPIAKVEHVTVTMLKHPDYRTLYRYYQKFLLGVAPLGQESLEVSLDRTYQLYEYWCFIKVVGYMAEKYGTQQVDACDLFVVSPEHGGISLRLQHGQQSVVKIHDRLKIYFQRQYNYYNGNNIGSYLHSY